MQKSKARIRLDEDRNLIWFLFGNNCVKCGRPTAVIHEIIPISHGRSALHWTNRVPLCDYPYQNPCHGWAHSVGTNNSIPVLQEIRENYLMKKFGTIDPNILQETFEVIQCQITPMST